MEKKDILIGKRIPRDYFITQGRGESDISVDAGSFHLALRDAGIEMCNIMTYSSVLPAIAKEVKNPGRLVHGSVMETIMSVGTCKEGELITAGLIYGWLFDRESDERYGGIVCKYDGKISREECIRKLKLSLDELYENGFCEDYVLKDIKILTESITPKKQFGTAIVALCFVDYVVPIK